MRPVSSGIGCIGGGLRDIICLFFAQVYSLLRSGEFGNSVFFGGRSRWLCREMGFTAINADMLSLWSAIWCAVYGIVEKIVVRALDI
jgi:hypothetical protein